jgi:regulator of protease activity HflC (stomatin/prohibitin superfamily)
MLGQIITIVVIFLVLILINAIKITKEYERGVIFRLGRLLGVKGPGLFLVIPIIDKWVKIDLRTVTMDIAAQEVITKDNVTIKVNAVAYFRVVKPDDAVVNVNSYYYATSQIAQTTLRSVLGQSDLDDLLAHREKINQELQRIIDAQTEPWGVKVSIVEVKDIELPENMRRAMAKQAEAERERRAKIIHADGEYQAAEKLSQAADIISKVPAALQLRYLQTLTEMASEKSSLVVFPIPINIFEGFMDALKTKTKSPVRIRKKEESAGAEDQETE